MDAHAWGRQLASERGRRSGAELGAGGARGCSRAVRGGGAQGRHCGDAIWGIELRELLEVVLPSRSPARMGSPYLGMGVWELLVSI
jgi:hypothetical protein